jgi:hypothetical protein
MVFGIREEEGEVSVMRDWELLKELNTLAPRKPSRNIFPTVDERSDAIRLKRAFDDDLAAHATMLQKPVSWPELLFLPVS